MTEWINTEMEVPRDGITRAEALERLLPTMSEYEKLSFTTNQVNPEALKLRDCKPGAMVTFVIWASVPWGPIRKGWRVFFTGIDGEDLDTAFVWKAPKVRKRVRA